MPIPDLPAAFLDRYILAFASLPAALQYAFAALIGLVIGSFLSVVVQRVPVMLERQWHDAPPPPDAATDTVSAATAGDGYPARYNLWLPGSACPHCGHPLKAWENIPVFSYLALRGRCAACRTPIGPLYPALELGAALLAGLTLWRYGAGWTALAGFGLGATLLALACIDARTQLLPDALTLPLLWAGLLVNLLGGSFASLPAAVLGAAGGYVFLWLVYWAFRLLRGQEGIGYGDFKLLAALGAWFGWQALPQIVIISAVLGALVGVAALATGRLKRDEPIPFGPFLAAAGIATLLFGMPLAGGLS